MKKSIILVAALAGMLLSACGVNDGSSVSLSSVISNTSYTDSTTSQDSKSNSVSSTSESSYSYADTSIAQDSKWNVDLTKRGLAFRDELARAMKSKKTQTCSYSDCLKIGAAAAAKGNKFVPFYHEKVTASQDQCNREHTWPDSRGTGKSGPGADPFIIRPTLKSDNSARGNNFYGASGSSKEWDPASIEFEGARGESARVALYCATMYGESKGFSLSNNPNDSTGLKTMGTLKYLIEWNNKYKPTEIEIQINNYLDEHHYGRNPFVDHPEYANLIWSQSGLLGNNNGNGNSSDNPNPTYTHEKVDSLSALDGNSFSIVSWEDDGYKMGLTDQAKSETLPWYLIGCNVNCSSDLSKMYSEQQQLATYKFEKQSDGQYTIKTGSNYLINYIDGTHYSIGLSATVTGSTSKLWSISTNGGGFTFKGSNGVYLEFYNGSFCGYKNAPNTPIYLYKAL